MKQPFTFPKPVAGLVSRLPTFPPSFAFTSVLNLALGRIIRKEYLEPLHGKQIAIHVKDVGVSLYFTVNAEKFSPARSGKEPDLAFSATAQDLFLLNWDWLQKIRWMHLRCRNLLLPCYRRAM